MGLVFKRVLTKAQANAFELARIKPRFLELWHDKIIGAGTEISAVIAGTYPPSDSTGDGELNGVPTQSDIANIIAGTYSHCEPQTDDYAIQAAGADAIRSIISDS